MLSDGKLGVKFVFKRSRTLFDTFAISYHISCPTGSTQQLEIPQYPYGRDSRDEYTVGIRSYSCLTSWKTLGLQFWYRTHPISPKPCLWPKTDAKALKLELLEMSAAFVERELLVSAQKVPFFRDKHKWWWRVRCTEPWFMRYFVLNLAFLIEDRIAL